MVNEPDSLATKVALVTGGARRIGAQIVRCLHGEGMNIALHFHRSADDARRLSAELNALRPDSVHTFAADLRNLAAIRDLAAAVSGRFTRMDALVNNASSFFETPLASLDDADYQELLDTNLKAPLFLSQAAAQHLARSKGCIVNIADIYASKPRTAYSAYSAAKAGLVMLTRSLALELAPDIRVNAIAPGAILWPGSGPGEHEQSSLLAEIPMRRTGDPVDVAQAVLFLVRDADYITGQVIRVDGGRAIG